MLPLLTQIYTNTVYILTYINTQETHRELKGSGSEATKVRGRVRKPKAHQEETKRRKSKEMNQMCGWFMKQERLKKREKNTKKREKDSKRGKVKITENTGN